MCICLYLILLLKHDIILFNAIHSVSVVTVITYWFMGSYVMTYKFCKVTFVKMSSIENHSYDCIRSMGNPLNLKELAGKAWIENIFYPVTLIKISTLFYDL